MTLARSEEERALPYRLLDQETTRCANHGLDSGLFERALLTPARSFVARPGKAFRARLVEGAYMVAGGLPNTLPREALEAIELLHAGSLIIDDIEDDADTRRGGPALHREIGTPRALNTGNWLYFVALSRLQALPLTAQQERDLLRAANLCLLRCHEGQALDIGLKVSELRRADVAAVARTTSTLKTGALVGFAARLGATVAHAEAREIEALATFGEQVGIALQMLDDLTSFECEDRVHKAFEDLRAERVSFVWSLAADVLDEVTYKHLALSCKRSETHELLRQRLAEAGATRGRAIVHDQLTRALSDARRVFPTNHALEALSSELLRLEKSYG